MITSSDKWDSIKALRTLKTNRKNQIQVQISFVNDMKSVKGVKSRSDVLSSIHSSVLHKFKMTEGNIKIFAIVKS